MEINKRARFEESGMSGMDLTLDNAEEDEDPGLTSVAGRCYNHL